MLSIFVEMAAILVTLINSIAANNPQKQDKAILRAKNTQVLRTKCHANSVANFFSLFSPVGRVVA